MNVRGRLANRAENSRSDHQALKNAAPTIRRSPKPKDRERNQSMATNEQRLAFMFCGNELVNSDYGKQNA